MSDYETVKWNRKNVLVNVRGYVAAAKRATQQAWEESIEWYDKNAVKSLTWTKVTGGIRCWPQFIRDETEVRNGSSTLDVLVQWGNRGYFDAKASAWMFTGEMIWHPGRPMTAMSCKWQSTFSMLQRALETRGQKASLSLRCTAISRN